MTQSVLGPDFFFIGMGYQVHTLSYSLAMPKKRDGIMTVRIPTDEKDLLQAIADQADVTLSDVVVRAVRDFIEANPIPAKGKKKAEK
jgi:hypothetical protein